MIAIHAVVGADDVWSLLRSSRPPVPPGSSSSRSRRSSHERSPPRGSRRRARSPRLRRLVIGSADPATSPSGGACPPGAVPTRGPRAAAAILDDVRARGARAVRDANAAFGGGARRPPRPRTERPRGRARRLDRDRAALDQAIDHVRRSPRPSDRATTRRRSSPGIEIERAGCPSTRRLLRPGGSAPYPSSLVMTVVPAGRRRRADRRRLAGRPRRRVDPVLLGAAGLLEVDALLVAGGAQAVGGLAFGWVDEGADAAFAPVDRIVGPGNAWVTAAKLEVAGIVGIDLPAGPSRGWS
jgi:histidinol dehydrogenase